MAKAHLHPDPPAPNHDDSESDPRQPHKQKTMCEYRRLAGEVGASAPGEGAAVVPGSPAAFLSRPPPPHPSPTRGGGCSLLPRASGGASLLRRGARVPSRAPDVKSWRYACQGNVRGAGWATRPAGSSIALIASRLPPPPIAGEIGASAPGGAAAVTRDRRAAFPGATTPHPIPPPQAYEIHTFRRRQPCLMAWNWVRPRSMTMGPGLP